jgi:hypothetical protein
MTATGFRRIEPMLIGSVRLALRRTQRAITKDIYANEARALAPWLVEGHRLDPASLNIEIEREADFFKKVGR